MSEPMPAHDERHYAQWAYKRREALTSKRSRVLAALDWTPKTPAEIGAVVGLPASDVSNVLRKLKSEGCAISWSGGTWMTAETPTIGALVSLHAGNLACRALI